MKELYIHVCEHSKKDRLFKIKYVTLLSYLFFSNEILLTRKSLSWFEITDDNENKQYADNQCP